MKQALESLADAARMIPPYAYLAGGFLAALSYGLVRLAALLETL